MKFNQWLEQQYLAWEAETEQRQTLRAFADYLNISNSMLSHYLSGGREPSQESLDKIADKLANLGIDKKKELPTSFNNLLSKHQINI